MDPRTINLGRRVTAVTAERLRLDGIIDNSIQELDIAKAREELLEKVEGIYQRVMTETLSASFALVEDLISEGLATVYGDHRLKFKLEPTHKRGSFSVEPSTYDVVADIGGPTEDTFGGAVVQIESFLLRVVFCLQLKMIPVLVLDESFNCVSAGYLSNLAKLIHDLCQRFNLDLLLVTHKEEMAEAATTVFHLVDRRDGKGVVLKDD